MLMVLNLHSFWGFNYGSGIWQALDFFRESTSICAVDCFILISGYFGIKWKFRSFFNLIFQIFFYSVGLYLVVVGLGIVDWSLKEFIIRFGCLFTRSWGFAITFVLLYFCSPVLNAFSEKSSSREMLLYIIVFFIVINFVSIPRFDLFTYALVYLVGRWLRKANVADLQLPSGKAYWIVTVLMFVFVYILCFSVLHFTKSNVLKWPFGIIGYNYAAPLVILQAVFLFMFFARLSFKSKFVNWCAASSFAIYLIHMHPTIKQIGYYAFTKSLYEQPPFLHVVALVAFILAVFFACIFIDKIRIATSHVCFLMVESLLKHVPVKIFKIETYLPSSMAVLISK